MLSERCDMHEHDGWKCGTIRPPELKFVRENNYVKCYNFQNCGNIVYKYNARKTTWTETPHYCCTECWKNIKRRRKY